MGKTSRQIQILFSNLQVFDQNILNKNENKKLLTTRKLYVDRYYYLDIYTHKFDTMDIVLRVIPRYCNVLGVLTAYTEQSALT